MKRLPAGQSAGGVRLKITIRGAVQGVGFRPFVYRLATELGLAGWVNNSPQGVFIEAEGPRERLELFLFRIEHEKPPHSFIQSLEPAWLDPEGFGTFAIRPSAESGAKSALVLPDIATCPDCLREIFDPRNRRYQYPFTNCTHCGPRFSIIEALPYDRANTSMRGFNMCADCRAEYQDPRDRRFHAQPNACPMCGPRLHLWDSAGKPLAADPLTSTVEAIRTGKIVAVKGLGGFHLMVAAENESAVSRLRERKQREEKPFALMFPSITAVTAVCEVSPLEERLLRSPESPIVLLRRLLNPKSLLPHNALAPGNPYLGGMLPYTPLHHLLLSFLNAPVVATSGNLSDEPICIDEYEALDRLAGIADLFLVHNRPIVRHVDDSITRIMAGRELVLRRARGYAPLPVKVRESDETSAGAPENRPTVLAVGAHLKNTVALAVGDDVFVSQHIGDLETEAALRAFERVVADLERTFEAAPRIITADAHPDYLSTQYARARCGHEPQTRYVSVQHHLAHVLSCMGENELRPPFLGVAWDGTGYGLDGTVWGGEFFLVTKSSWERVAHIRPFRLPGGDAAIKEPRRTALGLLYEAFGEQAFGLLDLPPVSAFGARELDALGRMLVRGLNSPYTSSAGRLFDAVTALAGLKQRLGFEGQAAMQLEFAADDLLPPERLHPGGFGETDLPGTVASQKQPAPYAAPVENQQRYGFELREQAHAGRPVWVLDWAPVIRELLADLRAGLSAGVISRKFHLGMANTIVQVARRTGQEKVLLSGGCFQNRILTESAIEMLRSAGFRPYWHQRVPPNDGGIALGQVIAARDGMCL